MQPNLLRNLCFLLTKNTKYRTFYRTHFLLISITCLSRYISLSFYRPALIPTVHVTLGSLGSWTRLSFPHNKRRFLRRHASQASSVQRCRWCWWALARNLPRDLTMLWKAILEKQLSETNTNPEGVYFAQKCSIHPNCFFKLGPCLSWESNSLTV